MRDEQGLRLLRSEFADTNLLDLEAPRGPIAYLFDNMPEMVFLKRLDGQYTYMNAAALACLGHGRDFLKGRNATIFDLAPPDAARRIDDMDRKIMSSGEGLYNVEEQVFRSDGQVRWYSGTRIPLFDGDGKVIGLAGISRDITSVKMQETLRRHHANLLEMIVQGHTLPSIMEAVITTVEGMLSKAKGSILFLDEKNSILRNASSPGLPESYTAAIDGVKIGPKVGSCGTAAWRREPVYVSDTFQDPLWGDFVELVMRHGLRSCWSTPIMGNGGVILGTFAIYSGTVRSPTEMEKEIIAMATNIAGIAIDRRRAEERIHFMAHHDPLTGLSNRNLFWNQFGRALHEARREKRLVAITYLDLDNFKQINDIYGHAVGDEVLRCFAERVTKCIRSSDIAVRLGGDEFAIIFSNPNHDVEGITRRLQAIQQQACEPMALEHGLLTVSCSSGTAFFPHDGDTAESLLAKADAAMYQAKKSGRNRIRIFEHAEGGGI